MTDAERDELLARIDERTEAIPALERAVQELKTEVDRRFDGLGARFVSRDEFNGLVKRLDGMVTLDQFNPVRMLVYGAVTLMLAGMFGALITLVLAKQ